MRTRRENKEKRFSYGADVYGLSSDEEEEVDDGATRRASRLDASDANFEGGVRDAENGNSPGDKDDASEGDDDDAAISNDDDLGDDEVVTLASDSERTSRRRVRPKKEKPKPSIFVHQVPLYPTDIRQTRIYVGLLKRWTRHHQLADLYYGPSQQHLGIVYDMMRRWLQYHVLPGRSLSHQGGVMASPWLAEGFERRQEERHTAWFKANIADKEARQRTHSIAVKHAQRFVTYEDRELKALLGPHTHQTEVTLKYGQSLSISESGAPVTDRGSHTDVSNGWLFDVGGLVLSMKWAPSPGQGDQILAMAVIPHSDQAYREVDDEGAPDEKADGCIQFWRFTGTPDSAGVVRPSLKPPQLSNAICFSWGRPKRLEWCPMALPTPGLLGLLAVLSGDGKVRVASVRKQEDRSQATYG